MKHNREIKVILRVTDTELEQALRTFLVKKGEGARVAKLGLTEVNNTVVESGDPEATSELVWRAR